MLTILTCSITAAFIYFLYKCATKNQDFFSRNGIKNVRPCFLLGNVGSHLFKKLSLGEWLSYIYSMYPEEKIVGVFHFLTPFYFIRDPELIKRLTIKDFDHFSDHQQLIRATDDPILGNILTKLSGQKWHDMRSTLSPAFTGSKMRQMSHLMMECAAEMVKYLKINSKPLETQSYDMKDIFSRVTTDVIGTCAFGVNVNSLAAKENDFFKLGKDFMKFSKWQLVKFLTIRLSPRFASFFNIKLIEDNVTNYFRSLILNTMKEREEKDILRPDMINILMQVRKGTLHDDDGGIDEGISKRTTHQEWTDDELVAQCLVFFLAGFDTSSTLLSFVANELALNPDVQEKLYDEIIETGRTVDGRSLTYETVISMKYMDMLISESLRKWPPAPIANRLCVKDYPVDEGDNLKFTIKKGEQFWIPIYALHHDARYFPDPEKFDPERFSQENRGTIRAGTYLPFGSGPRNCIGSRFALMQIKIVLYHLLKDFRLEMCGLTKTPLTMGTMTPMPKKGIHLGLRIR